MALFDHASIALSMTEVGYYDEGRNQPPCRVHLLLTEYAKDQYVLLLCELADGALVCDDPPRLIRWVPIPGKRLNFGCDAIAKRIDISMPNEWSFSLFFEDPIDYWEMMRIIAEVNTVEALQRKAIDDLVHGAIATIPTVRLRSPSPVPRGVAAASGEILPAVDVAVQVAIDVEVPSSPNSGASTPELAD